MSADGWRGLAPQGWTLAGWTYEAREDMDGDREHWAVSEDDERRIDHTRHEAMTAEAFAAHVRLGFPDRPHFVDSVGVPGTAPWRNETIIDETAGVLTPADADKWRRDYARRRAEMLAYQIERTRRVQADYVAELEAKRAALLAAADAREAA